MGLFSTIGKVVGAIGGTAIGIGPGAGAAIGGTLGGLADGSKSSKANKNAISAASQAQIDAQNRIIALQEQRYGDAVGNLTPSITAGNDALTSIRQLLGLGAPSVGSTWTTPGAYQGIASAAPGNVDWAAYVNANPDALAQWKSQTPDLAPFGGDINKFGAFHYENDGARRDLSQFTSDPAQQQQGSIDALKASPLYQSLFGNGRDAILGASSATGGLRGGNVNDALFKNGRDTLAQVIQQQLQNLGGIQSSGQQAGLGLAGIGANNASQIGSSINNIGNNQAGAILGRQGVVNANNSATDNLLGSLFGSSSGLGGGITGLLSKFDPVSDSAANGGITGTLGTDFNLDGLFPGVQF